MKRILVTLLSASAFTVCAMPKYYQGFAKSSSISADKLYAVALAEAGVTNEYGHSFPWPWSVSVDGSYYQFKSRQELFVYLQKNKHNQKITYGVAGRPLTSINDDTLLWQSLSVESNLNYIVSKLKSIQCDYLSQCIEMYRLAKTSYSQVLHLTYPSDSYVKQPKRQALVLGKSIRTIVNNVANRHQIDPALIHAVIARESAYKQYARSHAGAMGLMQLMPSTAKYLGLKPSDYYDVYKNVDAGTRYLKEQLHNFNGNVSLALAAYNAGPGAVRKYNGIPPYKETQKYVPVVLGYYRYFKSYLKAES